MPLGSMIFPESFSPPAPPDPAAAARPPPSILLDLDAYIADRSNATTATATSNHGHTIQVSFWAADPPAMSYLCVHCPCAAKSEDSGFEHEPRVVGAEGRFVLLRVRFADGDDDVDVDEYFMYRGDPDSPSLESVPLPRTHRVPLVEEFGIVPRGDEGHYLLVARSLALGRQKPTEDELDIYSSVDQTWSVKPLPDAPGAEHTMVEKVITLGEGVLGWVDFRKGVVVCDVLHEPFDVRFFPLPSPMPENRERLKEFHPGDPAMRVRDVTFSNGVIKFIEVEHHWIVTTIFPEKPIDPSETNVLHDSDLLMALKNKDVDDRTKQIRKRDGWRAVTWRRTISSNCWHKGCVIDADEIAVDDSIYSSLMSGLGDEHDKSLKFRNLWPAFPTLSTDVDDLVYLKSTVRANDTDGWLIALDLAKKTLTGIGSYSFARHDPCIYGFCLCSLSNHLNMASADSSQTTKLKDSMEDPLTIKQSNSEEASCPHVVPKIGLLEQVSPKAQEHNLNAQNNQECRDSNALTLPGSENCLPQPPPQPEMNQLNGAGKGSNTHDAVNPLHAAARSTGGCLPMLPPQKNVSQWSGAADTHPNAHDANPMHAAGLTSSSCPPQPPQQAMSQWNGVSYHQNHPATYNSNPLHAVRLPGSGYQPWPPQQNISQPWNGVAGYQDPSHTHGINQNHWNAAGYQNQWGAANYSGCYSHYGAPAPNLDWHGTYYPGQFPGHADDGHQPGSLPAQAQAAQHQRPGAPEQWSVGSGGGNATQTWTPRKRWREEQG